jgi:hypothetical protein
MDNPDWNFGRKMRVFRTPRDFIVCGAHGPPDQIIGVNPGGFTDSRDFIVWPACAPTRILYLVALITTNWTVLFPGPGNPGLSLVKTVPVQAQISHM